MAIQDEADRVVAIEAVRNIAPLMASLIASMRTELIGHGIDEFEAGRLAVLYAVNLAQASREHEEGAEGS